MTLQPQTDPRIEVCEYLRQACESVMTDGDLKPQPKAWCSLGADDSRAASEVCVALSRLPGNWFAASLLSARARAVCDQTGWPELAQLARCIELFPTLVLSKAQVRRRSSDSSEIYSRDSERLQAMLEKEIKDNPGGDHQMTRLIVHRDRKSVV